MALPSITDSLTHAALKLQELVPMDAKNPFDGVEPDFSIFGVKFNKGLAIGLGAFWGLSIVYCGWQIVIALNKFNAAKSHHDSEGITKGKEHVVKAAIILVAVVAVPVIVGGLVFLGNSIASGK